jgi:D-lactate dehydrogenase
MDIAFFSTKEWVRDAFDAANEAHRFDLTYYEPRLGHDTARLAVGHDAVCAFVNDDLSAPVIDQLADAGVRIVAMRCAGYNNVDIEHVHKRGLHVVRVPAYSPHAVAEHTLGLILALNRRYHRAYWRVRDGNFALDGLMGFDLNGKTVGVVGTGRIGRVLVGLFCGFGCTLLVYDKFPDETWAAEAGAEYVGLDRLYSESDIITLHCPLTDETHHMINHATIEAMKPGVMLINTSRGPLVDTDAVIDGLKSRRIGYLGLDVYEEESELFFEDLSEQVIQDDTFVRLETFPNVLITAHQAFFTREAVNSIAETTLGNIADIVNTGASANEVIKSA